MSALGPEFIAILMLGGVLVAVLTGFPLAVGIGGVGFLVGVMLFGPSITLDLFYDRMFNMLMNYILLAVPLFVFMGTMMERSGVAEGMYEALYLWFGGLRGGLAITTVVIGAIVAACVGIIGASVTMLALIALPAMINRGYDKSLAAGAVCAGGTLGILIPPSIMLVIYGPMAGISVGKLFFGAFIPGFTLAGLYCVFIAAYCLFRPAAGPPIPVKDRQVPFARKMGMLLVSLVPPVIIILAVLGTIFLGVASPTEAAGVGSVATTILAVAYRRFSLTVLKDVSLATVRIAGMILLIGALSFAFVGIFMRAGCDEAVVNLLLSVPGGKWGIFALVMFIFFILGFFIDWIGILYILVPMVTPIGAALGFDAVWFAMMICINLQMSFMTPPFAYALFYVKGVVRPEWGVTTGDIIRGMVPYVLLIVVGLGLCIAFPQIILWLPGKMLH
jgi:tripartite ATP-independent transporter DctM subunit